MDIIKLQPGESAPGESDCISIQEAAGGQYLMNASALVASEAVDEDDEDEGDSVAVIGGPAYNSYDEAEAAGLAWAAQHGVEQVYIARSTGTAPLLD